MPEETFRKYFKTDRTIDGAVLKLDIVRMDMNEWLAFRTGYRHMRDRAERAAREKTAATTQEAYEAVLAQERQNDIDATEFNRQSITDYARVSDDCELTDDDEQPVRTGAQLFELYGRSLDAIAEIITAIWLEHSLTKAQKKAWRLRRASASSLAPTTATPNGNAPAPTAANAENSSSAPNADATALNAALPSGTTAH